MSRNIGIHLFLVNLPEDTDHDEVVRDIIMAANNAVRTTVGEGKGVRTFGFAEAMDDDAVGEVAAGLSTEVAEAGEEGMRTVTIDSDTGEEKDCGDATDKLVKSLLSEAIGPRGRKH